MISRLLPRHSLPHVARLVDEYLVESLDEQVLAAACEFGASPVDLDFLLSRTFPDWKKVVASAARGGHLHVFRWMTERPDDRGPWEADFKNATKEAARYGRLEIVKWLHARGFSSLNDLNALEALHNGHLAMATYILLEGNVLRDYAKQQLRRAAHNGHRTTLQWIYLNFTNPSHGMAIAAKTGDLDMLQWLHQTKSCWEDCSIEVMDAGIGGGNFHVVEWLLKNCSKGCSASAVCETAKAGNLPMLRWLHKHYSDRFTAGVMASAAANGQLETVKWLHEHRSEGCSSLAMDQAASEGHLDVVRWLHDNRTEGCTAGAMDRAAKSGHLDVVKGLHENTSKGCTDTAMYGATGNGFVDVLRWLVEHYPAVCRADLVEIAGWEGQLDAVRYLDENTYQRASSWGFATAARQGWLKAQLALMQHYLHVDGTLGRRERDTVGEAFGKILVQSSSQHEAPPVSSLGDEALESLELSIAVGSTHVSR